jgi:hypothetical protein
MIVVHYEVLDPSRVRCLVAFALFDALVQHVLFDFLTECANVSDGQRISI